MPSGNPLAGVLDVLKYTPSSYVYTEVGNCSTVLKGQEIWCHGKSQGVRHFVVDGALQHEAAVYDRLGDHPLITKCLGLEEVGPNVLALRLERSTIGSIRYYIIEHPDKAPPMKDRLRMSLEFAEGMHYLHEKGVIWGDASVRNALFFDDLRVKLCDFGGSTWEGCKFEPGEGYEIRYELPLRGRTRGELTPTAKEIFALGSAIYEMTEWKIPDGDLSEEDVDMKWRRDQRPDPSPDNPAGDVIKKCWLEIYGSVSEAVEDLKDIILREVREKDQEAHVGCQ
ncbi:kinase-like domain-containing protein [Cercophora scortea]|uniref:Kinase-like domain-containing protein n=1 Tax=Cercophora scortea TaxID=314031 RepID=A0AAE0IEA1_9PEZI|nr:kinase-like domain-containing protein [Cercophora scortea]